MPRKHRILACLALAFVFFAASDVLAAKRQSQSAASAKVEQLVRLMDKDK